MKCENNSGQSTTDDALETEVDRFFAPGKENKKVTEIYQCSLEGC